MDFIEDTLPWVISLVALLGAGVIFCNYQLSESENFRMGRDARSNSSMSSRVYDIPVDESLSHGYIVR